MSPNCQNINGPDLTLNWTITGATHECNASYQYQNAGAIESPDLDTISHKYLNNLLPNMEYKFSVFASNAIGRNVKVPSYVRKAKTYELNGE